MKPVIPNWFFEKRGFIKVLNEVLVPRSVRFNEVESLKDQKVKLTLGSFRPESSRCNLNRLSALAARTKDGHIAGK